MDDIIETAALKVTDRRNDYSVTESQEAAIQSQDNSPAAMMMAAISKGMDLDKLGKFMELQERYDANEAKKAFFIARAAFNKDAPEILKDKENSQFSRGDKKAMYTSLGNLLQTANPALGKHDLSASFDIKQNDGIITVSCILSHKQGHSDTVTLSAPPDASGGNAKNPIQQIKSTITYLKGATFEAVTGLAVVDETNLDDDGNGASPKTEYITPEQAKEIKGIIEAKNIDTKVFFTWTKTSKIEEILAKDYDKTFKKLSISPSRPKTISCAEKDGKPVPLADCDKCSIREGCPSWS